MQSHEVKLHMYDISMGMAKQFSPALLGRTIEAVWHTGIVVYNREYYFGGGISGDHPAMTPFGSPTRVLSLGSTQIPYPLFMEFLKELEPRYTEETYHVFKHNCNNFTNECANFLLGKNIPEEIINLPNEFLATPLGKMIEPFMTQMQDSLKQKSNPIFPASTTPSATPPAAAAPPPPAPAASAAPPAMPSMPGMPGMPPMPSGAGGMPDMGSLMNNLPPGWQNMAQQFLSGGGFGGGAPPAPAAPPQPLVQKKVIDISTLTELEEYKRSYKAVAVDCWSPTCPPCMRIKPEFEKLAQKFPDIKFLAVNTSMAPALSTTLGITAIPQFFFYLRGERFGEFKGANQAMLEQNIFQLQDQLDSEKKVLKQYKVFNPYKKQPILFTAKSSLKVILSKVKLLGAGVPAIQAWLKDGVDMNEALLASIPTDAIAGIAELFGETPSEEMIALFDLFRLVALDEAKLTFILQECWGSMEVVFVMLCEAIEGAPSPKQMNAMLVALRFLCNIFAYPIGQSFFSDHNVDGLFFFLNGVIEKAGQKSPKIVNACAVYLYNLRLFFSGSEDGLSLSVENTLRQLFELVPKMTEIEEGLMFALCAYAHKSKEFAKKYKAQLLESAGYVKSNAKPGSALESAAEDLLQIVSGSTL